MINKINNYFKEYLFIEIYLTHIFKNQIGFSASSCSSKPHIGYV